MPRLARPWLAALAAGAALLVGAARPARAQGKVEIVLPAKEALATQGPSIRTTRIVTAPHTAELIRNGFPARLHYKLERWSAGQFVNDLKSQNEWEVIVEFDALNKEFRVVRATADRAVLVGAYDSLATADSAVAADYRPRIGLPKPGERSYYRLALTVEAMSLSDLDEVRRWLRGELRPAVRGRRNPGTAVTSGVRTLFVRILGGERLRYDANTGVFKP